MDLESLEVRPAPTDVQTTFKQPPQVGSQQPKPPGHNRRGWLWFLGCLLFMAICGGAVGFLYRYNLEHKASVKANQSVKIQQINLNGLGSLSPTATTTENTVNVNGQLNANQGLVIKPAAQPAQTLPGQVYFDQTSGQLRYYNGQSYVSVASQTDVQTLQTKVSSIPTLGVVSLQGLNGALNLLGGSGLTVTVNGTDIALNLPQNLTQTASPTFGGLSLTSPLSIASGGTGANSQQAAINSLAGLSTSGDLLYFDGTNTTRLPLGANTQCLTSNGTTLVWTGCAGAGSAAPSDASYLTLGLSGTLSAERVLTPGSSISVTDGGANGNYSINTIQDITNGASPQFAGLKLTNLASVGVVQTDISGALSSSNLNLATGPVTGLLGAVNGGTGINGAAAANGQLLIGNSSGFTLANLIQGAGVTITNGSGSITVAAPTAGTCPTCANQALSNLASVAINTTLLPNADNTIDLGSVAFSFHSLYADTSVLTPTLDVAAAGTLSVGTTTATGITIGNTSATSAVILQGGTGGVTIGSGGVANTIQIGNTSGAVAQSINIGNNPTASSSSSIVIGSVVAGTTILQSAGGIQVTTLGAATNNSAALCRDVSTNILTSCDATNITGLAFLQGGNKFNAAAILGTNDSNSLSLETNALTQATIAVGGATTFKNSSDSAAAFRIQNAAGTATVFNTDTASLIVAATGTLQLSNAGGASATLITDSSGNLNISTPGSGNFDDEFTSTTQNPAWTFNNGGASPAGTNSLVSTPGSDTVSVASGTDHDCSVSSLACPRLLLTSGGIVGNNSYETSLNTKLTATADLSSYSAGIIFTDSPSSDFIRFAFRADVNGTYVIADKVISGVQTTVLQTVSTVTMPNSPASSRLRVKLSGTTWTFYYSINSGSNWLNLGSFTEATTMSQVGVFADNAKNSGASAPALAEPFDYFRITPSVEGKFDAGSALFKNANDSTSSFQVQTSTGSVALDVDTTNNYLGVNVATPGATLNVQGNNSAINKSVLLVQNSLGNSLINLTNDGTFQLDQNTGALGFDGSGANSDSSGADYNVMQAEKVTPTSNVSASGITVFFNGNGTAPNNQFAVGIYSDSSGTPGTLLASGTATNFGSWRSVVFGSSVSLTANTPYWLATNENDPTSPGTRLKYNPTVGISCTSATQPYASNPMPSSWPAISAGANCPGGSGTKQYLIFANLSSVTPTPVLQVNPDGSTTLQNTTNSTTAFQVLGAGGNTQFLGIDTTGNGIVSLQARAGGTINIGTVNSLSVVIGNSGGTGTLTVNGHVITGGVAQVNGNVTAGAAANCGSSASAIAISGNDTSGTVSFSTGTASCSAGTLVTLAFGSAYASSGANLRVILTPANAASSALQYYNGTVNTSSGNGTSFTIDTNSAAAATTAYKYNYLVVQ